MLYEERRMSILLSRVIINFLNHPIIVLHISVKVVALVPVPAPLLPGKYRVVRQGDAMTFGL